MRKIWSAEIKSGLRLRVMAIRTIASKPPGLKASKTVEKETVVKLKRKKETKTTKARQRAKTKSILI